MANNGIGQKQPPLLCGNKVDVMTRGHVDKTQSVKYLTARDIERGRFRWSSNEGTGYANFLRFTKKKKGDTTNRSQHDADTSVSPIPGPSRRSADCDEMSANEDKKNTNSSSTGQIKDALYIPEIIKRWSSSNYPPDPKLVLWLVGNLDEKITEERKMQQSSFINRIVCRELVNLTAQSESWLLVQCNESALFKYIGAAIDDHRLCAKNKTATVVGLTRWPYEDSDASPVVTQQDGEGAEHTIVYQHKNLETRGKLNPNIDYYIFSDSPGNCVLQASDNSGNSIKDMFQCVIAMNGDGSTISTLAQKVKEHIPIVLINGTDGVTKRLIDIKTRAATIDEREELIDSLVFVYFQKISEHEAMKTAVANILNYEHLTILDPGDNKYDTKIERTILENISKGMKLKEGEISDIKEMNFELLCISLNMYDVFKARQEAQPTSKNNRKNTLQSYTALEAMRLDQVDFVRHFIGEDKHFKKAISKQDLQDLYTKAHEFVDSFSQVPKKLNELLGSFYIADQMYVTKDDEQLSSQVDSSHQCKDVLRHLFIWSLLCYKLNVSLLLWEYMKQPMAAALFAYGVLKGVAKRTKDAVKRKDINDFKRKFLSKAVDTLNACYEKNEEETFKLLRVKMPDWGKTSCINLAIQTNNKQFLVQQPCQDLLIRLWKWDRNALDRHDKGDVTDGEAELATTGDKPRPTGMCADLIGWEFSPSLSLIFWFDVVGLLMFLIIFAIYLVTNLEMKHFDTLEWVLWPWIIIYTLEGGRMFLNRMNIHLKSKLKASGKDDSCCNRMILVFPLLLESARKDDAFKFIEFFSLLFFYAAWLCRCIAHDEINMNASSDVTNDVTRDVTRDTASAATLILYSIDFIMFSLRIFKFFYNSRFLGPLMAMIKNMLTILCKFLSILLVIFVAFAIGFASVLYPNTKLRADNYFHIFSVSYWSLFGDISLATPNKTDDSDVCTYNVDGYRDFYKTRCANVVGKFYVPILFAVYVMITNILLFNLVIAKFNSSIDAIERKVDQIWNFQRFQLTQEYSRRIFLPPPFTVLICGCWRASSSKDIFIKAVDDRRIVDNRLKRLERLVVDEFLAREIQGKITEEQQFYLKSIKTEKLFINGEELNEVTRFPNVQDDFLLSKLHLFCLTIKDVPEDEDSLLWAIIVLTDSSTIGDLRQNIYEHVKHNPVHYERIVHEKFENWSSELDKLVKREKWREGLDKMLLYALANVLRTNLVIFRNKNKLSIKYIPVTMDPLNTLMTSLYLAKVGKYYKALEKLDDNYPDSVTNVRDDARGRLDERVRLLRLKEQSVPYGADNVFRSVLELGVTCKIDSASLLREMIDRHMASHRGMYTETHAGTERVDSRLEDVASASYMDENDSVLALQAISNILERHIFVVTSKRKEALRIVSPTLSEARQKKPLYLSCLTDGGKVHFKPLHKNVQEIKDKVKNTDDEKWEDADASKCLKSRLKLHGLNMIAHELPCDIVTAVSAQHRLSRLELVKHLRTHDSQYINKDNLSRPTFTDGINQFEEFGNCPDSFVHTVVRAVANVTKKNVLLIFSDCIRPFCYLSPFVTKPNEKETIYLSRKSVTGSTTFAALIERDSHVKVHYDKRRGDERFQEAQQFYEPSTSSLKDVPDITESKRPGAGSRAAWSEPGTAPRPPSTARSEPATARHPPTARSERTGVIGGSDEEI